MSPRSPPADVVLLAAGRSSRMGEPKGLVVVKGRPWLDHQIEALGERRAIVVLGNDREAYLSALSAMARPVVVAVNPDPDRGPFSSLQAGLALVTAGSPAFVLPIDVPAASAPVWLALEDALEEAPGALDAAAPTHEGRAGHPVLLSAGFVALLLSRPAGSRLDHELAAAGAAGKVVRVPVSDPRVRLNLNAPEDWVLIGGGVMA